MADVYVNALTQLTEEPTANDSLVMVNRNTNEGQIIDYNLLADVILNKLTTKSYSGLSTTAKALIGAINELTTGLNTLNAKQGVVKIETATFSTLPYTIPSDKTTQVTADMEVVEAVLSNPSAQTSDWEVDTGNQTITIKGSISGTTSVVLKLQEKRS